MSLRLFIECFGFSYENQCSFLVGVMKHQISCSDFTDYIGNVAANDTGALGPGGGTEEEREETCVLPEHLSCS